MSSLNWFQSNRRPKVTVAVATYRRPDGLARLLESLATQDCLESATVVVVVVDNDPAESGLSVVSDLSRTGPLKIEYVREPVPGIAAARNAAWRRLDGDVDFVAFIDDDELAPANWIRGLLDGARATGATVLHGPVEYQFPASTPRWVKDGGFFISPRLADGAELRHAATNNLLVDMSAVRRLGTFEFDDRLGLSGGSDVKFTDEIRRAGGRIRWWNHCAVTEVVPEGRTTPQWVLRRAIRAGESTAAAVLLRPTVSAKDRLTILARGGIRVPVGVAHAAAGALTLNSARFGAGLALACRGLGMARRAAGLRVVEYRRVGTEVVR